MTNIKIKQFFFFFLFENLSDKDQGFLSLRVRNAEREKKRKSW